MDFPHLVATRLLAGGPVDEVDLFMLLRGRSPEELAAVEALCQKFRLTNSLAKVLSRVRG